MGLEVQNFQKVQTVMKNLNFKFIFLRNFTFVFFDQKLIKELSTFSELNFEKLSKVFA